MGFSDLQILQSLNGLAGHHRWLGDLVGSFTETSSVIFLIFLTVIYFTLPHHPDKERRAILIAGLSGVIAIVVSMILTALFHRERPFIALPPDQIHMIIHHVADSSFPSNHALGSAALAFGIWRIQSRAIRWITMITAILVGVSRIVVGVHWPSDVLISFALGGLIAWGVHAVAPRLKPLFDFGLETTRRAEMFVIRTLRPTSSETEPSHEPSQEKVRHRHSNEPRSD